MSAFGATLQAIRRSRTPYLSQSRLAEAAGFDHSYISRCEMSTREPSRKAVLAIAEALDATDAERDSLLEAAGFRAIGAHDTDPLVAELDAMLRDETICAECRQDIRDSVMVALMIVQRRLERGEGRVAA